MTTGTTHVSRADLHCHSTASQVSKLGVQRALGLPLGRLADAYETTLRAAGHEVGSRRVA